MKLVIDSTAQTLTRTADGQETTVGLFTREAFEALSLEWLRVGWNQLYYHNFSWFGAPILQTPEDLMRLQEVVYRVRPQIILETGVFRGGSLLFHATLLDSLGEGRVIGVDREIAPADRDFLQRHRLGARISLVEGDSTDPRVAAEVASLVGAAEPVLVVLDSDHSKAHVLRELELYSPLVTPGSYIVAADGIMRDLADLPRGLPEWKHDNPLEAANEFAARHPEFRQEQPPWLFHDGDLTANVTYWPGAWLKRIG
ncbi:MAG: CmcI family methyltransferase [Bryobacteraceae bacterium]